MVAEMKHKGLKIGLCLFFAVMIVATVAAENIYYDSLPFVTTGEAKKAGLSESFDLVGHVAYGKKKNTLFSEFNFQSVTFLKQDGDTVAEGDGIYSVSPEEVLLLQKTLELEAETLKEANEAISETGDLSYLEKDESLQYEINTLKIKETEKKIARLQELYAAGGVVAAGEAGEIRYLGTSGSAMSAGAPIAEIEGDSGKRWITWQLPAETGVLFGTGDSVETTLSVKERKAAMSVDTVTVSRHVSLTIEEMEFSPENQSYSFKASVPEDLTLDMADGTKLSLVFQYQSEVEYGNVVPTQAVIMDGQNEGYIYVVNSRQMVYGKEYYVTKTHVEIQRSLPTDTALTNLPEDAVFVTSSTKELTDGAAVKLMEPEEEEEEEQTEEE